MITRRRLSNWLTDSLTNCNDDGHNNSAIEYLEAYCEFAKGGCSTIPTTLGCPIAAKQLTGSDGRYSIDIDTFLRIPLHYWQDSQLRTSGCSPPPPFSLFWPFWSWVKIGIKETSRAIEWSKACGERRQGWVKFQTPTRGSTLSKIAKISRIRSKL